MQLIKPFFDSWNCVLVMETDADPTFSRRSLPVLSLPEKTRASYIVSAQDGYSFEIVLHTKPSY